MSWVAEQLRRVPRPVLAGGAAGLVAVAVIVGAVAARRGEPSSLGVVSTLPAPSLTTPGTPDADTTTIAPASGLTSTSTSTSTSTTTTAPPTTVDIDEIDDGVDKAAVSARPIPAGEPETPPPPASAPPPWAESTERTPGGLATDIGCADNLNAAGLDSFFAERLGPVLGWDYPHIVSLGGGRYLWLFQDTFVDHGGTATTLDQASFIHNAAAVQDGRCFTLLHRGTASAPTEFEPGDGTGSTLQKWFWPMGGDSDGTTAWVFWAEMVKDAEDPPPGEGLGWHPERTWIATYDAATLERRDFRLAPNSGAAPIYGYAVDSDHNWTYLFANTFEQNLTREGGFWNVPHSGSKIWLARIPRHDFFARPDYRTADGWSHNPDDAVPIVDRFNIENPMQPRLIDGQWVSSTKIDGYWGNAFVIDVAENPWGPWYPVDYAPLLTRGDDPLMNSYHAHLLPWRDGYGSVQIVVSNNARDMLRDAFPHPWRYRPVVFFRPYVATPTPTTTTPPPPTTTTTPTTVPPTSVETVPTTTVPVSTVPTTTTTTTTTVPTTSAPPTSTTTTTTSTTTTTPTTTTTVPPTPTPTPTVPSTTAPPSTPPSTEAAMLPDDSVPSG